MSEFFKDGKTFFHLNSDTDEGGNVFQNVKCSLVKTIKIKNKEIYLIETEKNYSGVDFGYKPILVNNFLLQIRRPSNFNINDKNDVLIYLFEGDLSTEEVNQTNFNKIKLIQWGIIDQFQIQ